MVSCHAKAKHMNRRSFLRSGSIAGASIPFAPFVQATESPLPFKDEFSLNEATVDALQALMKSGKATSESITRAYLKRIGDVDKAGPKLNTVIELNPDAVSIAVSLDKERKAGQLRGPLHGIPMLIKDNIDTGDRMMTTAGSLALEGNHAAQDAFIIRKLRAAGAVILGKTNPSEFANFRSTRSTSGWSSRGGQTRNPYLLDRNPSGSSSGSGSAVSANLCAIAIGTETNGSIASPSSVNGIVGIKPTVGLWSRSGIIPISHTQDTAGPMARTVKDAAILLGACTGVDNSDVPTADSEGKAQADYTTFLVADALKGKRIGYDKNSMKGNEDVAALFLKALNVMQAKGATMVEVDFRSRVKGLDDAEHLVFCYEFKDGLNRYLASSRAKVRSLRDVIEYNKKNASKAMPYFKQELLEESDKKEALDSKEFLDALSRNLITTRKAIDGTLGEHKLDALLSPCDGPSWCTDLVNGDAFTGNSDYGPAAIAGYPHITVPMGFVHELPVGLCFIGTAWTEGPLISLAYGYEQASKARRAPKFLPSLQV